MNPANVTDLDYINCLVASPMVFSCTKAARIQPLLPNRAAHDARTRLLHCLDPDSTPLWHKAAQHVPCAQGILARDDTTLDKPYAKQIDLIHRQWSGNHHRLVQGINLITLVWSDGTHSVPVDYRLYDKPNAGAGKHAHFQALVRTAHARGFRPCVVAFASWYGSLQNLKVICSFGWVWLTQLKSNRQVDLDRSGNQAVRYAPLAVAGTISI